MKPSYELYAIYRDMHDYTDYAVSKGAGVPSSSISDWKKGRCHPRVGSLMKIAKFLDLKVEDLVDEEEE